MTAGQSDVICPECGEPMRRDRRVLVNGRTPFRCENGHLVVHDNEPVQSSKGTVQL